MLLAPSEGLCVVYYSEKSHDVNISMSVNVDISMSVKPLHTAKTIQRELQVAFIPNRGCGARGANSIRAVGAGVEYSMGP